jgi:hypothetical protein
LTQIAAEARKRRLRPLPRLQVKVCTICGKGEWTASAFPSTMIEETVVQIPPSARMRIAQA